MKRRKLKIKSVILLLVGITFIVISILIVKNGPVKNILEKTIDGYLASSEYKLDLYELKKNEEEEEETLEKSLDLVRGEKIKYYPESTYTNEELEYTKIKYEDKIYYVLTSNIVEKLESVVLEE